MKKFVLALGVTLFFNSLALADILRLEGENGKIETVTIGQTGTINADGQKASVGLIGAGLRTKKVLIANVKVYVAQLLASEPEKFVRTSAQALRSLDNMRVNAIQLHFLRSVEAEKVLVSFQDALIVNQYDLKAPHLKSFLEAVAKGGDALEGKTLTVVTMKNNDGTETVIYENTAGQIQKINGPVGFASQVLSIWLGQPSDAGIESLKSQIIDYKK